MAAAAARPEAPRAPVASALRRDILLVSALCQMLRSSFIVDLLGLREKLPYPADLSSSAFCLLVDTSPVFGCGKCTSA
jgi:hypothetical protein